MPTVAYCRKQARELNALAERELQNRARHLADGDIRRVAAGSVVLAEDTTGKGHISRHPREGQLVAHIEFG